MLYTTMGKKEKDNLNGKNGHLESNGPELDNVDINNEGSQEGFEGKEDELQKVAEELKSVNDKYLRLYSEFENFRKRTQKEKLELYSTAGADVFKSLLPILDDFERAKKAMEETDDLEGVKKGIDLIYNKLITTLKQQGLEPMEHEMGEEFDSEKHDAITQIAAPDEKLKNRIVDVVERGYKLKDKVIRYAKVVVGK